MINDNIIKNNIIKNNIINNNFHDIQSITNIQEPLNTASSLVYFIVFFLVYQKNPLLATSILLLAIGSLNIHAFGNKLGYFLDNQAINLVLLALLSQYIGWKKMVILLIISLTLNSMRLTYILLTSIFIIILVVNIFKDFKVSNLIILVSIILLIFLSLKVDLITEQLTGIYKIIIFFGVLLISTILIIFDKDNTYKRITYDKSIIAIILYFVAYKLQVGSRIETPKADFSNYYHSGWHIITAFLVVYMSKIL